LASAGGNYYPPDPSIVELGQQYGVNGTSETGTYNPPPIAPNSLTAVTDNGDGTYNLTFAWPVTLATIAPDYSILSLQPVTDSWNASTPVMQLSANVVQYTPANGLAGQTYWIVTGPPTTLTTANPFPTSPLITAT
jgi:hypothetical protein